MNKNDLVKFNEAQYPDEAGATYRILEINGDRCIIEYVCNLPIPPQSVALVAELEISK